MPVRKYRSVAEMPRAAFCTPLSPDNLRLACALSATAARLAPLRLAAGVYRYHSTEAAARARDAIERAPRRPAADPPQDSGERTPSRHDG